MEVIGVGLEAIGKAIGSIADAASSTCIVGIVVVGALIYLDKLTVDDVKELFNRKRRY